MNWNTKLFFRINALIGRYRWLDLFGRAGAEWAIIAAVGWYGASAFLAGLPNGKTVFLYFASTALAWSMGFLTSWITGLMVKEVRPHATYPECNLLFRPMSTWKSFPSDHAMAAFLLFFMALLFGFSGAWALLVLALWVVWGRVYAGAHYPIDIIGGLVLAGLVTAAVNLLLIVSGI